MPSDVVLMLLVELLHHLQITSVDHCPYIGFNYCSIKLKDTVEIGAAILDFPRTPLIAVNVLLSRLNLRRVRT